MEALFAQVMEVSCMLSPVILLLLLLGPLLRRAYTARWKTLLWLLLAVRLALPLNLSLPAAPVVLPAPNRPVTTWQAPASPLPAEPPLTELAGGMNLSGALPPAPSPARALRWNQLLAALWLAGVLAGAGYQLFCYLSFCRSVRRWSAPVEQPELEALFRRLCAEMGTPRVALLRCPKVDSPLLTGLWRPKVLLPDCRWDLEDSEMILRHELAHCRRRDLWLRLVLLAARVVHWFNPLVYLMERAAASDMEMACDSQVVGGQSLDYRRRYSESILSAIHAGRGRRAPLSTRFSGGKRTLRQRFAAILDTRAKRRGLVAFCLAAVLVVGVSLLAVWGGSGSGEEIPQPPASAAGSEGDALRLTVRTPPDEAPAPLVSSRVCGTEDALELIAAAEAVGTAQAESGSRQFYGLEFAEEPENVYIRYIGPSVWQEPYPYYDEALRLPEQPGSYVFFIDVTFAPGDAETFCFLLQVGAYGDQPEPLEEPHVAGEGVATLADGRTVTVQITLMENGTYQKQPAELLGGGSYEENYRGSYYVRVLGEKGDESTLLYSDPIYINGVEMNFPAGVFPLAFADYNGDGDPDFTLGQYAASGMQQFRLFTLRPTGRVEQLPWEGTTRLLSTQAFSVPLEQPAPGEIDLTWYHNGYAATVTDTLRWDKLLGFVQVGVRIVPGQTGQLTQAEVPALLGMTAPEAADALTGTGFGMQLYGVPLYEEELAVTGQEPAAGSLPPPGTVVQVTMGPRP